MFLFASLVQYQELLSKKTNLLRHAQRFVPPNEPETLKGQCHEKIFQT